MKIGDKPYYPTPEYNGPVRPTNINTGITIRQKLIMDLAVKNLNLKGSHEDHVIMIDRCIDSADLTLKRLEE